MFPPCWAIIRERMYTKAVKYKLLGYYIKYCPLQLANILRSTLLYINIPIFGINIFSKYYTSPNIPNTLCHMPTVGRSSGV
jgi:hypothetical protein